MEERISNEKEKKKMEFCKYISNWIYARFLEYDGKHKQLAPLKGGEIVLH